MIEYIEIEKLHPHPDNPRKDLGDITELADSIRHSGVLQNLTVVPATGGYYGDYTVIIGHRRLAAAQAAGLNLLPCTIVEMSPEEQVAVMLAENMQRADLTIYEQAQGMQMMLDLGYSVEGISEKTGLSESTVRRRVRLTKLDDDAFKSAESRQVDITEYDRIFELKDADDRNAALRDIGTNNFNNTLAKLKNEETHREWLAEVVPQLETIAQQVDKRPDEAIYLKWYHTGDDVEEPSGDWEELYYIVESYGISLYGARKETEKETTVSTELTELKERLLQLKAICKRMAGLRHDYIKNCLTRTGFLNKHADDIARFAAYVMTTGSYARWEDVKKVLSAEKTLPEEREYKWAHDSTYSGHQMLLAIAYCCMENIVGKPYNWEGKYEGDDSLTQLYAFLAQLDYELSDEEESMIAGTHEAYLKNS